MQLSSLRALGLAFGLTALVGLAQASSSEYVTNVLGKAHLSPGTKIYYPSDNNYTSEITQRWTIHDAPTFVAAVKPATPDDVPKIVKACAAHNISFLATGGGHGFTITYGNLRQGLELDLSELNFVNVSKESATFTVGPSTIFNDTVQPVFDAGFEAVFGSSPCVGMIGATIGGGLGRYIGLHGMMLDTLLSVDMVVANGTRLTASKTQNSDLFWAVRGAGANFGVILSATYQMFPLTSRTLMNWDMTFSHSQGRAVIQYLKDNEQNQNRKLSLIVQANYNETAYGSDGLGFMVNAVYIGSKEDGEKLVQPLLAKAGKPLTSKISEPTFAEINTVALSGSQSDQCPKRNLENVYGGSINVYDVDAVLQYLEMLRSFLRSNPSLQQSFFYVEQYPKQGPLSFPEDSTAYPWRNNTSNLLYIYSYTNTSNQATIDDFAVAQRAFIQNTSGFPHPQFYINYGHGDEKPEVWYGSHVKRLSTLKSIWDPHNVFSFNNPVPQAKK